jgi:hypothetical protein
MLLDSRTPFWSPQVPTGFKAAIWMSAKLFRSSNVSNGRAIEGGLSAGFTKMILPILDNTPGYPTITRYIQGADFKGCWTAEQSWPNQDCCEGTCARILCHPGNVSLLLQSEVK